MYIASGPPKAATHYLQNYLRAYEGVKPSEVYHAHYRYGRVVDPNDIMITTVRNPLNLTISWHRMRNKNSKRPTSLISKIPEVIKQTKPFIGWMTSKKTLVVRFEDLASDDAMLEIVGEYIGKRPVKNHRTKAWGNTRTFTGELSIWQEYKEDGAILWTDEVQAVWEKEGGKALEQAFGYDVNKPVIARY